MTRPIDETWTAAEHGVDLIHPDGMTSGILWSEQERDMGRTLEERDAHRAFDAARARLAAAAPAMARLLVGLEWGADICIGYDNITALGCPSCGGLQHDPGTRADFDHHTVGHDPDCALVAVLRAAGVME